MKNVTGILFDKDVALPIKTMKRIGHNDIVTYDRCEFMLGFDLRWFTTNLGPVNSVGAMHQYKDDIVWNW